MSETIGTTCVQGGYRPGGGEPRQVPIYQSTTWKFDTSEHMGRLFDLEESGDFYTRLANPTNDAVAAKIAELEGGTGSHAHRRRARRPTSSPCSTSRAAATTWWLQSPSTAARTTCWPYTMRRMGLECTLRRARLPPTRSWKPLFRRPTRRPCSARPSRTRRSPVLRHRALRRRRARARRAADRGQHVPHAGQLPSRSSGARIS